MNKKTKNIIAGALALAGIYFVYKYFKKPKAASIQEPPTPITPSQDAKDNYPFKKGSKGQNVKALQELILKIDSTLLPKYGADADFGSETESAIQKLLGKKSVDNASDYGKLLAIYNQKAFPLLTPNPNGNSGVPYYKPPFTL